MKQAAFLSVAAILVLVPVPEAVAQIAPVQAGIIGSNPHQIELVEKWGNKIYSNRMLDISPREFGRCTPDPTRPLVYCGASDGWFRAMRKDNGSEIWSMKTSGGVRAAPAVSPLGLFVATTDGFLYRLNPETGDQMWPQPYRTDNPVWGSPMVIDDIVYFSVLGNQTYAVGAVDGKFRFKVARDKPAAMSSEGVSEPAISGDILFSAFSDGVLVASNRFNGQLLWQQDLAAGVEGPSDADATPVVSGDLVFSGAFSAGPIALRIADGSVVWKGARFGVGKPVVSGKNLIVADADGFVAALDRETGKEIWVTRLDTKAAWTPVLIEGFLVVGGDRGLWILRAGDGIPLLLKTMPFGVTAEPGIQQRDLYFVAPGGTINAATLKTLY
ncbi:MAG TPA: PQQ-binding-like beta-propeller repeat protein [Myxococcota bacterium]|nr:PQQ-binding-like beta-propeller repeat protein [Myxococcota bacterium]